MKFEHVLCVLALVFMTILTNFLEKYAKAVMIEWNGIRDDDSRAIVILKTGITKQNGLKYAVVILSLTYIRNKN